MDRNIRFQSGNDIEFVWNNTVTGEEEQRRGIFIALEYRTVEDGGKIWYMRIADLDRAGTHRLFRLDEIRPIQEWWTTA